MSTTVPDLPGPGTATALLAAVAIYTAGVPAHLSDRWRGVFVGVALLALGVTAAIEYWSHH